MNITRRDAVKTMAAAGIFPLLGGLPKGEENQVVNKISLENRIKIITVLGDGLNKPQEHQSGCLDFNASTKEIMNDINSTIWWPDGNSSGVLGAVIIPPGTVYRIGGKTYIRTYSKYVKLKSKEISPEFGIGKKAEVQIMLPDGRSIGLDRFYYWVSDPINPNSSTGSTVVYPTGHYGVEFGKKHDGKYTYYNFYGDFVCPKGWEPNLEKISDNEYVSTTPIAKLPELEGLTILGKKYIRG